MSPRSRPRVLFVTSALNAVGGIPHYVKATIESIERIADVHVIDLVLSGSRQDQAKGFAQVAAALTRVRPDLLVLGHVGFGPIGLLWRRLGGRYAVIAYGIDVWGPPSELIYRTLKEADVVWPISTWTEIECLRTAPGARMGPVLGGNIAPRFFQEHEGHDGPFRALLVSRLEDLGYKGHDTAIEAVQLVAEHHPVELRIVGTGPAADELDRLIAEHDRAGVVRALGRVGDEELLAEYRQADVVVLDSRFHRGTPPRGEGLGLVLLEGAAAGTPGIGSRQGGSVDAVVDGETGYLIDPGDPVALADAITRLIEHSAERERLGAAAREFVAAEHTLDAFAERVAAAVRLSLD